MARLLRVGFTKNPRQLTARASVASAAKAQVKRNFDFSEGIFVAAPWALQLGSSCLPTDLKNCSRDDFTRRALRYLNLRRGAGSFRSGHQLCGSFLDNSRQTARQALTRIERGTHAGLHRIHPSAVFLGENRWFQITSAPGRLLCSSTKTLPMRLLGNDLNAPLLAKNARNGPPEPCRSSKTRLPDFYLPLWCSA